MNTSYVYFISNGNSIKIGKADNPRGRFGKLQTASDLQLTMLGVVPCESSEAAYSLEKELHCSFAEHRLSGEWFSITIENLDRLGIKLSTQPTETTRVELSDEPTTSEGDTNIGNLYRLMLLQPDLTIYEQVVYMHIGRYSLGYKRVNTNVPADKGFNRNSKAWADSIGISKTSFLKAIKGLSTKDLITIHKGSLYRQDGGSYPDYYSIKFNPELQKKYNIFFDLSGISENTQITKLEHQIKNTPKPTTKDENIALQKLKNKLDKLKQVS